LRKFLRETRSDHGEIGLRTRDGYTGLEATNRADGDAAAPAGTRRRATNGAKDVGRDILNGRAELGRKNADDRPCIAAQRDLPADD
jgi:hypothetical protein